MIDTNIASKAPRDTAAECRIRAAADRVRADGMDPRNGRRKFEESADSSDARGELLGRLEKSFDKRKRLDAASTHFVEARKAMNLARDGLGVWEGEGGTVGTPSMKICR